MTRGRDLATPASELRHLAVCARSKWQARAERAWLGIVGVPLAEIATGLLDLWWTWVPLTAVAWACLPKWRWSWLLALELGFVGAMWAAIGATALAHFPDHQLLVGVLWALFPLALAVVGIANRRRQSRPEAYFPFH